MVVDKAKAQWNEHLLNFTILFNNTGDGVASQVSIKVELPHELTFVSSSNEAARTKMTWNFTNVATGAHSLVITAKVLSGTPNNTVATNKVTLNYTDSKGNPRGGSVATASLIVRSVSSVKPPPTDTTRPSVTAILPLAGSKDISSGTDIEVTFSEPMNKTSAQGAFSISPQVTGTFSWDGNKLIFKPDSDLKAGTKYTVSVDQNAKDLAGNPVNTVTPWSFTVKSKPSVIGTSSNLMCIGGLIAAIVVAIAAVGYALTRKKDDKGKAGPTSRPKNTKEEAEEDVPVMMPVKGTSKKAPEPEEEEAEAEPVKEEEPELAQTRERSISDEDRPAEEKGPQAEPKAEEKVPEPSKTEEPPKEPEEKAPEPAKEEKAEPGPPEKEPEVKAEAKRSDIDEILKKLNG